MRNRCLLAMLLVHLLLFFPVNQCQADLVAYWSGDGTTADGSGNGHNGTITGSVNYGTGVVGDAFSITGSNSYITVAANAALEPTEMSVALWMKTGDVNSLKLVMDSFHGGSLNGQNGWAVQMNSSGQIGLAYGNGSSFPGLASTSIVDDDVFHHVAFTIGSSQMKVYVDGALEATGAYAGTPSGTGDGLRIGRHYSLNRQFTGLIDEARLYNHALTVSEVGALAAVPEPSGWIVLISGLMALFLKRKPKSVAFMQA